MLLVNFYKRTKRQKREHSLNYFGSALGVFRTKSAYNVATVSILYKQATNIVSKIIEDNQLTNSDRYNVLRELEEFMNMHVAYRIRSAKNSEEFMSIFGDFAKNIFAIPAEDERYDLIKKAIGRSCTFVFWSSEDNFIYSILEDRDYILKIINNDFTKLIKNNPLYSPDCYNLSKLFKRILLIYLKDRPDNPITDDIKKIVSNLEEKIISLEKI